MSASQFSLMTFNIFPTFGVDCHHSSCYTCLLQRLRPSDNGNRNGSGEINNPENDTLRFALFNSAFLIAQLSVIFLMPYQTLVSAVTEDRSGFTLDGSLTMVSFKPVVTGDSFDSSMNHLILSLAWHL